MGRIKGKPASWIDKGFKANTFDIMRKDGAVRELVASDEQEFKKLSRRYFERRNVYDNRVLAQRIGVESATTLPKQDLVDKLLDKVWGVQYFSDESKPLRVIEIGKIDADVELKLLEDVKKGDVIIGEKCEGMFEAKLEGGVLWRTDSDFESTDTDIYVLRNLVGEFRLRDGDRIVGRMRYVEELGYYCMFHIDELNGIPVYDGERPETNVVPVVPYEKLPMSGNDKIITGLQLFAPVCYGQFGVVTTNGRMNFADQAIKIFDAINQEDAYRFLFLLEEKEYVIEKAKEKYEEQKKNVCCSALGEKKTKHLLRLLQFASAQARGNGSKFVVIVSDLDMLDKTEGEDMITVTGLASYAGAYSNGGSVTVIAIAGTYSPLSAYHTVRNRMDFELALKSNLSISQNVIDILSSYSFSNREVSRAEAVAIAKLQQFAVTEGNSAVEKRLSGYADADEIITQLND
ncbi:MAG: hypothetical protein J6C23_03945 [Clostridia bacterium]|nr:hypothetical protein [Clostridia bacterium]